MKIRFLLLTLLMLLPCIVSASVNQTFEQYASDAEWVADGRGGWELTGASDFVLADNTVQGGINPSSKCLHITSAPGTAGGNLKISFAPLKEGALKFKVRYPGSAGSLNYSAWVVGGSNPTLFHGVFYEYLNETFVQYGSTEPYGGYAQQSMGVLTGDWHTVDARWTADGRLTVSYDGVVKVQNVPLRDALGSGLTYFMIYTPDGTGTSFYGTDCYIDDVFVGDPTIVAEQKFDEYADTADWLAKDRGGWALTDTDNFVIADNPLSDPTNQSSKVLHITPGTGSSSGNIRINFDAVPNGTITFKAYSPAASGPPNKYASWSVNSDTANSIFHGMFYEYLNRIYGQYGNIEPVGGYEQAEMGGLAGRWHTVHITWSEDGRVNMWEDGAKYVDDKPMRGALGGGVNTFILGCPGSDPGSDTYIDDVVVREGIFRPTTYVNYSFDQYVDNTDWLAKNRGGWILDGDSEFELTANPVPYDSMNPGGKSLRIVSAPDTPNGTLRIDFDAIPNGKLSFDVYSPAQGGQPLHMSSWVAYSLGPNTLFHGVFYEYLNQNYLQYGSVEPFGGFDQIPAGVLAGNWHKIVAEWTYDGRVSMWQDGVKWVDNKPMRDDLNNGVNRFLLASADGTYACDTYIDNVVLQSANLDQVATPVFTPDGGMYPVAQKVSISCETEGADIYYTTDGTQPDATKTLYTGTPIDVAVNMTIKAKAFKSGMVESDVKSATYIFPTAYNRPYTIPYTSSPININGELPEWDTAQWIPLDKNYDGNPTLDIPEAYYAAKWGENGNKVYMAVKVRDTYPFFTSVYTDWNARDAVELYIHTTGTGSIDYSVTQADAQQYTVGFTTGSTASGSSIWQSVGYNPPNGNPIPAGAFDAAGKIVVDQLGQTWLQYEAAITPYHHFSLNGTDMQISRLASGQIIGLDVTAVSHNGSSYRGMKAENLMRGKSGDYTMFGLHLLTDGSSITDAKNAADGAGVVITGIVSADFGDFFYIEDANRTYGIRIEKAGHGLLVGNGVTVSGVVGTLGTGERSVKAVQLAPAVDGDIKPVGLTNKALGGATFGLQSGVVDGSGLNNIGLLVKTTGRVGEKGDGWFMVDDGSGVSVKVFGSAPTGNPYVAVTGISSCENVDNTILRAVLTTSVVEMAQ